MAYPAGIEKLPLSKHQEKSLRTRERLLDATIECLVEFGYSGTSMQEVCDRAGLSRGAQLHHFPTKAQLLAAAVEHLTDKQRAKLQEGIAKLPPGPDQLRAAIDLLWKVFSGPLAKASMELWMAARVDPELREVLTPVERSVTRRALEALPQYAPEGVTEEQLETLIWLTLNEVRGLAVDEMLGGDPRRRAHLLESWKAIVELALSNPDRLAPPKPKPKRRRRERA